MLGSAAICCQPGRVQPTRECTQKKDKQNKAAEQMALNLPPLVKEKAAKTRCFAFFFLTFPFFFFPGVSLCSFIAKALT